MNTLKKIGYGSLAILAGTQQSFAVMSFEGSGGSIDAGAKGSDKTIDVVIKQWVNFALGFMALAAVIYFIYGGFMILSAGGDDGKVKKGKTILTNAGLGLIVIFIAYSVVSFLIKSLFGAGQ
ncbi:MAG: hypothetical protein PHZ26_02630 [Candidatus Gracilibacteria bacterium]|nr:hypothetical protein [Candidatus Gracilibacteria bacterium]MDD2908628.1 hypothetical protein [Candidatus Gracilibacteria bacterium]